MSDTQNNFIYLSIGRNTELTIWDNVIFIFIIFIYLISKKINEDREKNRHLNADLIQKTPHDYHSCHDSS